MEKMSNIKLLMSFPSEVRPRVAAALGLGILATIADNSSRFHQAWASRMAGVSVALEGLAERIMDEGEGL